MTCQYCGVPMEDQSHGSLRSFLHPGGPCPAQPVLLGGETFTRSEVAALKRVAQAQIEIEKRREKNA